MDKLLEALGKTSLSAQQVDEVKKAVESMIAEAANQIKEKFSEEFKSKSEEAYDEAASEIAAVESQAYEGYQEAFAIIQDQKLRLESLQREYEDFIENNNQQAFDMLEAEKNKNQDLAAQLNEEYSARYNKLRDFMVDKLDEYLRRQQSEIYDEAVRDVLADPRLVEHRVAIEKMAEIMTDYLQVEGVANNSAKRLNEATKEVEELRGRLRTVEQKNVRLSTKNTELNEALIAKDKLVVETQNNMNELERRNRKNGNASGRGQRVINENTNSVKNEQVIPEFVENKNTDQDVITEGKEEEALILAGIITSH